MARLGAPASRPCKFFAAMKVTHCPLTITPTDAVAVGNRRSGKGAEVIAIETLVTDLHPGA
jgi:hypothetical protein